MEANDIEIPIPEGYEIDEAKSTATKIIFKRINKSLAYDDITIRLFKDKKAFSFDGDGYITETSKCSTYNHWNNATSEKQLMCIIAKNKLANVARYLNGDWKPNSGNIVTGLKLEGEKSDIVFPAYSWYTYKCYLPQFAFKSRELAEQAVELLGKETVKLALYPLY